MKVIITGLIIAMFNTAPDAYSNSVEVPENIGYYEYCYNSRQCDVPTKYVEIIEQNIMSIGNLEESVY